MGHTFQIIFFICIMSAMVFLMFQAIDAMKSSLPEYYKK